MGRNRIEGDGEWGIEGSIIRSSKKDALLEYTSSIRME
jgi:hypothetical protein